MTSRSKLIVFSQNSQPLATLGSTPRSTATTPRSTSAARTRPSPISGSAWRSRPRPSTRDHSCPTRGIRTSSARPRVSVPICGSAPSPSGGSTGASWTPSRPVKRYIILCQLYPFPSANPQNYPSSILKNFFAFLEVTSQRVTLNTVLSQTPSAIFESFLGSKMF